MDKLDRLTGESANVLLLDGGVQEPIQAGQQITLTAIRCSSQFFLNSDRCLQQMGRETRTTESMVKDNLVNLLEQPETNGGTVRFTRKSKLL
ncbi:MAG: hypothetical protein ABGZ53_16005 [Fuerstiella sp.]